MLRLLTLIVVALMATTASAQPAKTVKKRLGSYFNTYQNPAYSCKDKAKVEHLYIRTQKKEVEIVVSEIFLGQPFTNELVATIYQDVREYLPSPYNRWKVIISVNGYPIEQLVPATTLSQPDSLRYWGSTKHNDYAWTTLLSRPYEVSNGLEGKHIALWASHGRYYDFKTDQWRWQRPGLFGTCEDILTQTFVVPFLMPMLENAGAVVFSPREIGRAHV